MRNFENLIEDVIYASAVYEQARLKAVAEGLLDESLQPLEEALMERRTLLLDTIIGSSLHRSPNLQVPNLAYCEVIDHTLYDTLKLDNLPQGQTLYSYDARGSNYTGKAELALARGTSYVQVAYDRDNPAIHKIVSKHTDPREGSIYKGLVSGIAAGLMTGIILSVRFGYRWLRKVLGFRG
jgi:hypothetical protein